MTDQRPFRRCPHCAERLAAQADPLGQPVKTAPEKFIEVYSFYGVYKSMLSH